MQAGALRPYERSLVTGAPLALHCNDDRVLPELDVQRWLQPADPTDRAVLDRTRGSVLDIGCGPGRIVEALAGRSADVLGIDIAPTAVALARARGLPVAQCDVFGRVPGAGSWGTAVLLDGNIGIGGDPERLLSRARYLIATYGFLLVETNADESADERLSLRFRQGRQPTGPHFMWALVGRAALCRYAASVGFIPTDQYRSDGRAFTILRSTEPAALSV